MWPEKADEAYEIAAMQAFTLGMIAGSLANRRPELPPFECRPRHDGAALLLRFERSGMTFEIAVNWKQHTTAEQWAELGRL